MKALCTCNLTWYHATDTCDFGIANFLKVDMRHGHPLHQEPLQGGPSVHVHWFVVVGCKHRRHVVHLEVPATKPEVGEALIDRGAAGGGGGGGGV